MKTLILTLALTLSTIAQADDFQSRYAEPIANHLFKALQLQVEARNSGEGMCIYYKSDLVKQVQVLTGELGYGTSVVQKLKTDRAIQSELGDSLAFKIATSETGRVFPYQGIEKALIGVTLWGPAPGVFGNMSSLKFVNSNSIKAGELVLKDGFNPEWTYTDKEYSVRRENSRLIIRIGAEDYILSHFIGKDRPYESSTQEWNLVPASKPDANPHLEGFVDTESECEA